MKMFGGRNGRRRGWLSILAAIAVSVSAFGSVDGNAAVVRQTGTEQDGTQAMAGTLMIPLKMQGPAVQITTGEPDESAAAEQPVMTSIPAEPAVPDAASGPQQPSAPGSPAEPAGPDTPVEPQQPSAPGVPAEPQQPAAPSSPSVPAEPQQPSVPSALPIEKPETEMPLSVVVKQYKTSKNPRISWNRIKGAVSFKVYRSAKKNGTYKKLADRVAGSRQYIDQTVERGNEYYYRVTAVMKDGSRRDSRIQAFVCPLDTVANVKLIRYSASSVKVEWKPDKQAACYKVYYAVEKSGKYKRAGRTKKTWYRVKGLKNNQTYYFRVKACSAKKPSERDSALSDAASITTRDYERTTVFAGDSITTGLSGYNILDDIKIGGNKDVVASIGLNTITFCTRRVFSGQSALGKIIAEHPYRVYLMIGTNEVQYRGIDDIIDGYREIVQTLKKESPDTDIVLLAVPPVTSSKQQQSGGFAQIPLLNSRIKAMAAKLGVHFYDYTNVLKDTNGCLQSRYAAGDGIHWTPAAYQLFAGQIEKYDKTLD